jgi:hypothetical protein
VLDEPYLKWLRKLPCIVCGTDRWVEAAHVGRRGLGQKCSDREALPLCEKHHLTGPCSQHLMGASFWVFWNLDRNELIEWFNQRYEIERRKSDV